MAPMIALLNERSKRFDERIDGLEKLTASKLELIRDRQDSLHAGQLEGMRLQTAEHAEVTNALDRLSDTVVNLHKEHDARIAAIELVDVNSAAAKRASTDERRKLLRGFAIVAAVLQALFFVGIAVVDRL